MEKTTIFINENFAPLRCAKICYNIPAYWNCRKDSFDGF